MTTPRGRVHYLDAWGCTLHLAYTQRQLEAIRQRFNGEIDPLDAAGGTTTIVDTGALAGKRFHVVIFVNRADHNETAALVNTCAHEATHAAAMILDHFEQKYDGNSETLAYLVGWLTEWIWSLV